MIIEKIGVVYSEILLPENATKRFENRSTLWNEVEQIEKGKNARLSREIVLALPVELNWDEQIKFTQDYVKNNFVNNGMIVDVNIRDKEDGNPHAHIMLTVHSMDENGEWQAKQKKEYILDKDGNKQYDKNNPNKEKLGTSSGSKENSKPVNPSIGYTDIIAVPLAFSLFSGTFAVVILKKSKCKRADIH